MIEHAGRLALKDDDAYLPIVKTGADTVAAKAPDGQLLQECVLVPGPDARPRYVFLLGRAFRRVDRPARGEKRRQPGTALPWPAPDAQGPTMG